MKQLIEVRRMIRFSPEELPTQHSIALLIRHAPRQNYSIKRLLQKPDIDITHSGALKAQKLGKKLAFLGLPTYFYSSPLTRCIRTCEEISKGLGKNINHTIKISRFLGDPGPFVKDANAVANILSKYESIIDFMNAWFEERFSTTIIKSPSEGTFDLLHWIVSILKEEDKPGLFVFVSHDLIITPVLSLFFGYNYLKNGMIDYLDGLLIWLNKNKTCQTVNLLFRSQNMCVTV